MLPKNKIQTERGKSTRIIGAFDPNTATLEDCRHALLAVFNQENEGECIRMSGAHEPSIVKSPKGDQSVLFRVTPPYWAVPGEIEKFYVTSGRMLGLMEAHAEADQVKLHGGIDHYRCILSFNTLKGLASTILNLAETRGLVEEVNKSVALHKGQQK